MVMKSIEKIFYWSKAKIDRKKIRNNQTALDEYLHSGREPWSPGYYIHKEKLIKKILSDKNELLAFSEKQLENGFGLRVDERVVEYPWIFSKLNPAPAKLLDAGSTFNFDFIVDLPLIKKKDLSIFTYYPEGKNFAKNRISYLYGDLREMPFRDKWFDEIVCQSTIEHIDMDNSIYGYETGSDKITGQPSYEYLKAIKELIRILKPGGKLLLTFPFGKFEQHGFFQQFNSEMLEQIILVMNKHGKAETDFFKYEKEGWKKSKKEDVANSFSYNPHTGLGKSDDGAAHCRAVCCIEFINEK